jgi:hypothetical protein
MADAVESARQHVQEEPADELGGVEGHGLEPVACLDPVISHGELWVNKFVVHAKLHAIE